MLLINNHRAPGARLSLRPGYGDLPIQLTHSDLEVLARQIQGVLAASKMLLLQRQFAEKPRRILQHGDAVNGLFWYCELPAHYDSWGMNEEGDHWLYSFCRPDDFGNLVPADPFYHGSEDEQSTIF